MAFPCGTATILATSCSGRRQPKECIREPRRGASPVILPIPARCRRNRARAVSVRSRREDVVARSERDGPKTAGDRDRVFAPCSRCRSRRNPNRQSLSFRGWRKHLGGLARADDELVALEFLGGADINNNPRVRVERGKSLDPIKHWTRVCQITFDPGDPNLVCACVEIDDAWVSHDGGRTFERRNEGLHAAAADVHGMAAVNNGRRKLFAATAFGLHMSDDDGRHWRFHKLDSPWQYTRSIVERPDRVAVISHEWQRLPRMARAALSQPRLWRDLGGCGPTGVCAKLDLLSGGQSRRSDAWVRGWIVGSAVSHDRWRRDLERAAPSAW